MGGFGGIALRDTLNIPVIARVNGLALGGGFGHQQEDQQADGLVIGRVKRDGLLHTKHRGQRVLQAFDAAMRDGNTMAQPGRAEAFA